MGLKGQRKVMRRFKDENLEPKLVNDVDSIIRMAKEKGYLDSKNNIDLEKLAQSLNISVIKENLEIPVSGYLKYDLEKKKWIIGINDFNTSKRQRFTLAHELGHYYMHKDKNLEFEDTTFFRKENNSSIEYAANEFASQLIMPENRVRDLISGGIKNLSALADKLNVSVAAMRYRVLSLGYKLK